MEMFDHDGGADDAVRRRRGERASNVDDAGVMPRGQLFDDGVDVLRRAEAQFVPVLRCDKGCACLVVARRVVQKLSYGIEGIGVERVHGDGATELGQRPGDVAAAGRRQSGLVGSLPRAPVRSLREARRERPVVTFIARHRADEYGDAGFVVPLE